MSKLVVRMFVVCFAMYSTVAEDTVLAPDEKALQDEHGFPPETHEGETEYMHEHETKHEPDYHNVTEADDYHEEAAEESSEMFSEVDVDANYQISLDEVIEHMSYLILHETHEEFKTVYERLMDDNGAQIKEMFTAHDFDGNGQLSHHEWHVFSTHLTDKLIVEDLTHQDL